MVKEYNYHWMVWSETIRGTVESIRSGGKLRDSLLDYVYTTVP